MVFRPHSNGIHVYDKEDPGVMQVEAVKDNMSVFTKRQVASANLACNIQAELAYLPVDGHR